MNIYQHILLAADFSGHGALVAQRAKDLATKHQARLSIVHVVDNLISMDMAYEPSLAYNLDLSAELMAAAKKRLTELATELNVDPANQWLEVGSPKNEIVRLAKEHRVDLIVVGSHGRHGLALLLGSTANGVLHRATCDVLAVRLQDEN